MISRKGHDFGKIGQIIGWKMYKTMNNPFARFYELVEEAKCRLYNYAELISSVC